ncbi:MAG: AmmeMemoRadiSam system protein B [Aquificaceae bacterium]|nr:AmmeMemoRadiSam system protein B [Aquificaceae bacterium]
MKPKIRPVNIQPLGERFLLVDPLNLSESLAVPYPALLLLSLMDGTRDIGDIRIEFIRRTGHLLREEELAEFINLLDRFLLLDNDNFRRILKRETNELLLKGIRPMSHAGEVYPCDGNGCRGFLMGDKKEKEEMLGLMVPHMDIRVAKDTYWEGYGRLKEDRRLIIILGVSHYWHEMPFSALPLDMETPFGILRTRKDLLERLQNLYSFEITHDLLSYRMEHSIEFAGIYAKMLFPEAEALALIVSYGSRGFLEELADNLLRIIGWELKHTLIISSVDLSHVGKKFGDAQSYDPSFRDMAYLDLLKDLQSGEAFDLLEKDGNPTRIDGHYTNLVFSHMLKKAGLQRGRFFDYKIYYEEPTDSIVSYASLGF